MVRVWLVERTYSDDEQNLIILVYSTPDGTRYHRKERALTSFTQDSGTPASIDVPSEKLSGVDDPETRERYRREAQRMRESHEASDTI